MLNQAQPSSAIPNSFLCPISREIMRDPVSTVTGCTYERGAIEEWLQSHNTDPVTNSVLPSKHLTPNQFAKLQIKEFLEQHPQCTQEEFIKHVKEGDLKSVDRDVFLGAKVNEKCQQLGFTALHYAAQHGHSHIVAYLLEHGALLNEGNQGEGWTPLHLAMYEKHVAVIRVLLGKISCQREIADIAGVTPLHIAAARGFKEGVQLLLGRSVNLECKTIFKNLITSRNEQVFVGYQQFKARGRKYCYLPVVQSVQKVAYKRYNDPSIQSEFKSETGEGVQSALSQPLQLLNMEFHREQGRYELTPLHLTAMGNHFQVCNMLLSHGAQVDPVSDNQTTPLQYAAQSGNVTIARILVNNGADVNRSTTLPVIHYAISSGSREMVEFLVGKGAIINVRDSQGRSTFALANNLKDDPKKTLLEYLLRSAITQQANLDVIDSDGYTLLHHCAQLQCYTIAEELLELGANPAIRSKNGHTPLDIDRQQTGYGEAPRRHFLEQKVAELQARQIKKVSKLEHLVQQLQTGESTKVGKLEATVDSLTKRIESLEGLVQQLQLHEFLRTASTMFQPNPFSATPAFPTGFTSPPQAQQFNKTPSAQPFTFGAASPRSKPPAPGGFTGSSTTFSPFGGGGFGTSRAPEPTQGPSPQPKASAASGFTEHTVQQSSANVGSSRFTATHRIFATSAESNFDHDKFAAIVRNNELQSAMGKQFIKQLQNSEVLLNNKPPKTAQVDQSPIEILVGTEAGRDLLRTDTKLRMLISSESLALEINGRKISNWLRLTTDVEMEETNERQRIEMEEQSRRPYSAFVS